eukprot:1153361-Pelagomonas_calceolata.AAC.2
MLGASAEHVKKHLFFPGELSSSGTIHGGAHWELSSSGTPVTRRGSVLPNIRFNGYNGIDLSFPVQILRVEHFFGQ